MRQLKPVANMFWASLFFFVAIFGAHGCGDANNVTAPPPPVPLSPDAKLSSLTVSAGALQPEFSSEVLSYAVDVLTTVTSITVTATPQNASASMTINGEARSAGQVRTITLGVAGSSTSIQIVVTAVNGSQNTYIVTVNRAAPGSNNNLQSLTVSPGSVVPAFVPSTTSYTVDVASSVASVTVTAQPQDAGATVSINGQTATSRSVSLGAAGSSTPVAIVVTALNGSQKTYLVTVNRTAPGGNNNLRSLTVSPGPLVPVFAASTTSYTVDVATSVTSVTVTAQAQDAGATVSINGQSATSRSVSLGAAGSSTPVAIVVTAPNGTQKTYLATVIRAAPGGNNNLRSLSVTPGPLVPVFAASTTSYTVDVATSVTSVTVTAQAQDAGATVSINGQSATSRPVALGAPGSSTPISLVVTAPNGSQKTYLVTVNRTALGGNNNLQSLTVSPGPLTPTFTPSTTSYSVNVASTVNSVTVTATLQDTSASMTVNGQGTSSGQARTISLNGPGSTTLVTIEVTAPNGSQKTYLVTVNQAALGGNNNLRSLTVSPGPLVPAFTATTTGYEVDVAASVTSVTITAQPQDTGATVSINDQTTTTSLSVTLGAAGTNTPIPIEVTALNGSQKTYLVTVNRAALAGNNNLQSLTVSPGTVSPAFTASRRRYTVNVASTVASVTVTAQPQDTGATVAINGETTTSRSVTLEAAGTNTQIDIDVMAPNGSEKTYTVVVNRAAFVPSGNNNLSALAVSAGTLDPGFDAAITSYGVTAPNTTENTTVTATVEDSTATLTINGTQEVSGEPSANIALAVGPNSIPIVVTAENGATKTYTVTITREGP